MKAKTTIDVFELVANFKSELDAKSMDLVEMAREVAMMDFKIKSLSGNVFNLDFRNENLIVALWHLGKLDEFYRSYFNVVPSRDRQLFFRLVNEIRQQYQKQFMEANLTQAEAFGNQVIEMEIFRKYPSKADLN